MSNTDPWAGKQWTLNYADNIDGTDNATLRAVILVDKGLSPSKFTLKSIYDPDNNNLVAYRVDFNSGEMTECWTNCYLFPRGDSQFPAKVPGQGMPTLPLKPWVPPASSSSAPPYRKDYDTATGAVESENDDHPSIARLERDIHPPGRKPEAVAIWQVQGGVLTNKTFLSVIVVSESELRESGMAHGND